MTHQALNRFLLFFYGIATLFAVLNAMLQKYYGMGYSSMSYTLLLFSLLFNYGTKFLFVWVAILGTRRYLLNMKIALPLVVAIHVCIVVLLSAYSSLSLLLFEKYIMGYPDPITWDALIRRVIYGSSFNFFIYFSLMTIVYAFHYLRAQKSIEIRQEKLKAQLLDAKIKTLQSQLQPHFLFNALNDIASLIDEDASRSQDAISDLSEMLRLTLQLTSEKLIPLEMELAILRKYADLERTRFAEKLEIHMDNQIQDPDTLVPPLLLQPIVENAIKHGFSLHVDHLKISIAIQQGPSGIRYRIRNNGQPLDHDPPVYGTGISNILERLDTMFPGAFQFEMTNTPTGVETSIQFPISPNTDPR